MKNSTVIALMLIVALFCYLSYHIGRSNGFDQGWDKGYIRLVFPHSVRGPVIPEAIAKLNWEAMAGIAGNHPDPWEPFGPTR